MKTVRRDVESLPRVGAVISASQTGNSFSFQLQVENESEAIYEIPHQLRELGHMVTGINHSKLSLEDVFLRLTRS
jgi:hypothetical protein